MAPSIIHAHHEDRVRPSFAKGKGYGHGKRALPQTHSDGMSNYCRFSPVPNAAGVIKNLKYSVTVFDGIVDHPVAPYRVQIILVPAAERVAVAENKAFEQWRAPIG